MENKKVIEELTQNYSEKIKDVSSQFGDDVISIEKDALLDIVKFLKEKPYNFAMLLDLTCVDYQGETDRFEMVYHLLSITNNIRLRVKFRVVESDLTVDSLAGVWKNANWLEREVYDMFGIHFNDHPDLRRLFMYDGFEGHPLRKDYPLRKQQPKVQTRE